MKNCFNRATSNIWRRPPPQWWRTQRPATRNDSARPTTPPVEYILFGPSRCSGWRTKRRPLDPKGPQFGIAKLRSKWQPPRWWTDHRRCWRPRCPGFRRRNCKTVMITGFVYNIWKPWIFRMNQQLPSLIFSTQGGTLFHRSMKNEAAKRTSNA